jgi:uncharacterized damage-inducible protein DinB
MSTALPTEHDDLLEALDQRRFFLRNTLRGLTDEQAATRSTVSELTLGGIIKHVTTAERQWIRFIQQGPSAMRAGNDPQAQAEWLNAFRLVEGETLESVLADYQAAADETRAVISALPDLSVSQPLPEAPWFPPGARWSARRVLLHLIAETSQHAGHADIIREAIDGQKSMG